jgi:uncharacterized protein YbjT (DUF2867 family)
MIPDRQESPPISGAMGLEACVKILVTGGTGNVGGRVVSELLRRGADVRVLARKEPVEKTQHDVEIVTGDLLDPVSVEQAMRGVDKLFLLNRLRHCKASCVEACHLPFRLQS